jgi:HTTM domain
VRAWLAGVEHRLEARTELANFVLFQSLFCLGLLLQIGIHFREQLTFLLRHRAFEALLDLPASDTMRAVLLGKLEVPELGTLAFCAVGAVLLISLLGAALGYRVRLLLAVALAAYFLYFGQILELGYVRRKANLIPLILLILLMSPDLRRCRPFEKLRSLRLPDPDSTPAWPLVLVKLTLASAYFAAGLSKLRNTGWSWARGDVIQASLLEQGIAKDLPLAMWIAEHHGLCRMASVGTLVFELGFWTVLFLPRFGALFALAGLAFHAAIQLSMGIPYLTYWGLAYLVFLDLALIRWCLRRADAVWRRSSWRGPGPARRDGVRLRTTGG